MSDEDEAKCNEDAPKFGLQKDGSVVADEDDFCLKLFER